MRKSLFALPLLAVALIAAKPAPPPAAPVVLESLKARLPVEVAT